MQIKQQPKQLNLRTAVQKQSATVNAPKINPLKLSGLHVWTPEIIES